MLGEQLSLLTLQERLLNLQGKVLSPSVHDSKTKDLAKVYIKMISHDSRRIDNGGLYVALKGRNTHGAQFIPQALNNGAIAVALPTDTPPTLIASLYKENSNHEAQPQLMVPVLWLSPHQQRYEMAYLAEWVYGSPIQQRSLDQTGRNIGQQVESNHLDLIGITGTNGKTTSSSLLADILCLADGDVGLIGTIETRGGGIKRQSKMTTMESTDLHSHYRNLLQAGIQRCVMEVSSIGIEEARVAASRYQRAAFLNLSEDHLDYHGNMEAYATSKLRLFSELLTPHALSIVCIDGNLHSQKLATQIIRTLRDNKQKLWRYTQQINPDPKSLQAEIYWTSLELSTQGINGCLQTPQGELYVTSSLMGRFNADNIAVACALAISLDIPSHLIQQAIASSQIKGRMEQIRITKDIDSQIHFSKHPTLPAIRVDYAHTPEALDRAIKALKAHCTGNLWVLFGCGGDRDKKKRPLMGASCGDASGVVLSSDNPRDEDPHHIMNQVIPGLIECGKQRSEHGPKLGHYWPESDRGLAIHRLISVAQKNDLILIAGKGHEPYQEVQNGKKIPFSDQLHALQALKWKQQYMLDNIDSLHSEQLCNDVGGVLIFGQHQALSGAVIDTRKINQDHASAFFCLQGQRDGHDFIEIALDSGAKSIIVRRTWQADEKLKAKLENSKCAIIAVTDPEKALNLWARAHRKRVFHGVMIGLTGSNGKTSTKELLASALSEIGNCLSTEGNYNNHLGVPLTLLRLRSKHQFAVIEMGMNAPNEIATLTKWVKPDLALITTISNAHLEGLGSIEAIAAAKGEIITESMPAPVIMPVSIPMALRKVAQAEAVKKAKQDHLNLNLYLLADGHSPQSTHASNELLNPRLDSERLLEPQLKLSNLRCDLRGSRAQITYREQTYDLNLNILGRHQLENARLALAAGIMANRLTSSTSNVALATHTLSQTQEESQVFQKLLNGIAKCRPAPLRGEILSYPRPINTSNGINHDSKSISPVENEQNITSLPQEGLLWLDCYNANPQSILASIKSFVDSGALHTKFHKTLFVIGQVGELGERSAELHYDLGLSLNHYIGKKSHLFTVGKYAAYIAEGFAHQSKEEVQSKHFEQDHLEELIEHIQKLNPQYIFVKGSRSVRLERLVKPLHAYRSSL